MHGFDGVLRVEGKMLYPLLVELIPLRDDQRELANQLTPVHQNNRSSWREAKPGDSDIEELVGFFQPLADWDSQPDPVLIAWRRSIPAS